ncbi:MAG: methyltransferase domain-containing protein [Parvularculaceae bacterium]
MADVVDRLDSVTRSFPRALFYGAGSLTAMVTPSCGVGDIVHADLDAARTRRSGTSVVFDEEASPFAPSSFDLIVSLLTLHAANDPVGALSQMRAALRPDGLMIAVLFAEETLTELRRALYESESECAGGVSPRIAPFASVRDLGAALQRAGLALPVADLDRVRVSYRDPERLFADIRGMGEASCLSRRGKGLRRDTLDAAMQRIAASGKVTFDLVTITGWAPHESQQKPMAPGSAAHSLKKALENF